MTDRVVLGRDAFEQGAGRSKVVARIVSSGARRGRPALKQVAVVLAGDGFKNLAKLVPEAGPVPVAAAHGAAVYVDNPFRHLSRDGAALLAARPPRPSK